jgi:hypothetical protein
MDNKPKQGWIALHEETEIANFRLNTDMDSVLLIYRNLAKSWWWEGLAIEAVVEEDPQKQNRFFLHQTIDSPEFDQPHSYKEPYKLGYMEISFMVGGVIKPLDLRLVCSWQAVVSFWKELETILRKEFRVIDTSSEIDYLRTKIPNNKTSLAKWIFIANKIDRKKFPGGLITLGKFIKERYRGYPHSREVLGFIFRAKDVGLLNLPDSKESESEK